MKGQKNGWMRRKRKGEEKKRSGPACILKYCFQKKKKGEKEPKSGETGFPPKTKRKKVKRKIGKTTRRKIREM